LTSIADVKLNALLLVQERCSIIGYWCTIVTIYRPLSEQFTKRPCQDTFELV